MISHASHRTAAAAPIATAPAIIENVLGESREIAQTWPDGSYTCPFCAAAVLPSDRYQPCPNPACEAFPLASASEVLERRRVAAEQTARIHERQALAEWSAERERLERERRTDEVREVREAGYCALCYVHSGYRKRVRHRTAGYHDRQAS